MLLELQADIIYGPVQSRRLGRSLGVNALPPLVKICTFDCLYCQYGRAAIHNTRETRKHNFPGKEEVLSALKLKLKKLLQPPVYITFSGNGEPTLHPDFKEIVEGVRQVRDELSPTSKTAILSNSTTVSDPITREALALLDVRIMKLEAGTEEMFSHYNRPAKGITLPETVEGLATLGEVSLQSLFTKGPEGNFSPDQLSHWLKQVKKISPLFVQVYTLARQSPTDSIIALDRNELRQIHSLLEKQNIPSGFF